MTNEWNWTILLMFFQIELGKRGNVQQVPTVIAPVTATTAAESKAKTRKGPRTELNPTVTPTSQRKRKQGRHSQVNQLLKSQKVQDVVNLQAQLSADKEVVQRHTDISGKVNARKHSMCSLYFRATNIWVRKAVWAEKVLVLQWKGGDGSFA